MKDLNLIRKITWKYAHGSKEEFDDLFQEASLAYCEALQSFDPNKGFQLSTHVYFCISNHLKNVCKGFHSGNGRKRAWVSVSGAPKHHMDIQEYEPVFIDPEPIEFKIEEWPKHLQEIVYMVLETPEKYLGETPNLQRTGGGGVKSRIKSDLRNEGWMHKEIQSAFKDLTTLVNTL